MCLFFLVGCQPDPVGINVQISNKGNVQKAIQFYVLQKKILPVINIEAQQVKTVFVPAKTILSAMDEQKYSTGDLTIVNETDKAVFYICGYIEVATYEICGKHHFQLDI
jgi:hypothetical protein